ncbi:helix-turn-helix domain-containing protein [Actinomadura madurae]|uniref:helix-turn-helix domain-containing protein n=1 Tax=Actinomadura madurae TaxID=1993 RepID=UPI00399AFE5E
MTSPFVRRRRLGAELRTLREQSGMTADELARRIYRSRMTISKLENARCRPDIGDIVKIMKILGVTGDRFDALFKIACDAAERGWWDNYGDAMGPRQRMYADLESGAASIHGYYQIAIPGILQTPDFIWALVDLDRADGPLPYQPERMVQARLQRQEVAFSPDGPKCQLILDEFLLRRLAVPRDVMRAQLLHLIEEASSQPRLRLRVLDIDARIEGGFSAKSPFSIYNFPTPMTRRWP